MNRSDASTERAKSRDEASLLPADERSPFSQPVPTEERSASDDRSQPPAERILASLARSEALLQDIRAALDADIREQRHREFSPVRLVGALCQSLVVGLLLWALSDWIFGEPVGYLQIKLAFAAVLQLIALTGFLLGGAQS
jgi:hypothetical protein